MVARTIPKNYRNVTGRLASGKNQRLVGFESTLEKDFLLLLELDREVSGFEEQPVTIRYRDLDGRLRRYTPDVLVHFRSSMTTPALSATVPSLLCEVKYRDDLRQHWADYRPKFKVAWRYAQQQGWRFRLITEREVRTPKLENVRFLRRFRDSVPSDEDRKQLLLALQRLPKATPEVLLATCCNDRFHQAQLIPALWHLVAHHRIVTDLEIPLTMQSALRLPPGYWS